MPPLKVAWLSDNSIGYIDTLTLHWAQFVLRQVTIHGFAFLVCNQQSGHLSLLLGQEMNTSQGASAMLYGWEGNHRSGIALFMHHRLCGISTYWLNGLRKGDEYPTDTCLINIAPFTFCKHWLYGNGDYAVFKSCHIPTGLNLPRHMWEVASRGWDPAPNQQYLAV